MSQVETALITDAANLSVILLGVALLAGQLLKKLPGGGLPPMRRAFGKVSVQKFNTPELLVALALVGLLYLSAVFPSFPGGQKIYIFFLTGLMVFLIFGRRHDLIELWGLDRLNPRNTVTSAIFLVVSTAVTLGAMKLFHEFVLKRLVGVPEAQNQIQMLQNDPPVSFVIAMIVSACIMAPLIEETLFRGFLYPSLKRFVQPAVAAVIVSLLFGVVHTNLGGLLPLSILSLLLILAYEITGTLWVPMIVHSGFNLCNIIITLTQEPTSHAAGG